MTDRFPDFLNPVVDSSGNAISGAKLFFYTVGTSTKKNTYSDSAKTIANTNPVVSDSGGRFGDIFMLTDEQYKVVLAPAADTDPPVSPIDTWDFLSPVRSAATADIEVISKSADYTVQIADKGKMIEVDASSGAVTITLPPVATATNGFFVYVKKTDSSANVVTVDGDGAETIDGSPTLLLPAQNDTTLVTTSGTVWLAFQPSIVTPLPTDFINGLTLTADAGDTANDVNITAGSARDGADTENIVLAAEITKQIDAAWAVGDDAGGLDTGGVTNDTWYYDWLIKRVDTDVVDALFSLSDTAPTMPTNYDKKRLIGKIFRGTANNDHISNIKDSFDTGLLHIQDQKTSGTNGGDFTSGAWQTRDLNTIVTNEIAGSSLATNQITLPAGTYYIEASAQGRKVDTHKAKLYNITDTADEIIGRNAVCGSADNVGTEAAVSGRFTIAAEKDFELQHQCNTTAATTGFGQGNAAFGVIEIYSDVRIWKIG